MTLHQHTLGQGCPVLALHGWGLDSGVWAATQRQLCKRYRVTRIDLPGYGQSASVRIPWRLEEVAEAVTDAISEPSVWMGWSLGGMIAMVAAVRCPTKVRALVLVASTPCFLRKPDWPYGLAGDQLQIFAADLARDPEATVWRFLTLQAGKTPGVRSVIRSLRQALLEGGIPDRSVAQAGLRALKCNDLRPLLRDVRCPTLMLMGGQDLLMPPAAGQAVSLLRPDWQLAVLTDSAHAPFLSQQTAFLARLQVFLNEVC